MNKNIFTWFMKASFQRCLKGVSGALAGTLDEIHNCFKEFQRCATTLLGFQESFCGISRGLGVF